MITFLLCLGIPILFYLYLRSYAEGTRLRHIVNQVDDVLVTNWVGVKNGDYRKALHDLVQFEIQIHDDPAVSELAAQRKADMEELDAFRIKENS